MFQIKVVDKIKTHKVCSITLFENRAVYAMMWKRMTEPDRPLMSLWYGACTLRAGYGNRHTHSEYVTIIAFFTATMVTRTCLSITSIRKLPVFLFVFVFAFVW